MDAPQRDKLKALAPEIKKWPERMGDYYNADGSKLMRGTGHFKDAEIADLRAEVERLRAELAAGAAKGGITSENGGQLGDAKTAETRMGTGFEGGHLGSAPAAGTVKDAERYQALNALMQNAKGSASIEVNQHLAYYETAEPGQEVKLQWYPDTPIGFYTIEGATLDAVADEAIEFVREHTKAGKENA